ncbi:MAG: PIN domain-containing protein [Solirubrobacteraceae bacterium]
MKASGLPGRSGDEHPWGQSPLLIDTSAWARAGHPAVRERWTEAQRADRLRLAPAVRLEMLLSARGGAEFDAIAEMLSAIRAAPLTASIVHAAEDGMRQLAQRSHGAHRLPVVDYLLAATAEEVGAAVLHYDHDYDTLAEVMEFDSVWLAPAGSMP